MNGMAYDPLGGDGTAIGTRGDYDDAANDCCGQPALDERGYLRVCYLVWVWRCVKGLLAKQKLPMAALGPKCVRTRSG